MGSSCKRSEKGRRMRSGYSHPELPPCWVSLSLLCPSTEGKIVFWVVSSTATASISSPPLQSRVGKNSLYLPTPGYLTPFFPSLTLDHTFVNRPNSYQWPHLSVLICFLLEPWLINSLNLHFLKCKKKKSVGRNINVIHVDSESTCLPPISQGTKTGPVGLVWGWVTSSWG